MGTPFSWHHIGIASHAEGSTQSHALSICMSPSYGRGHGGTHTIGSDPTCYRAYAVAEKGRGHRNEETRSRPRSMLEGETVSGRSFAQLDPS